MCDNTLPPEAVVIVDIVNALTALCERKVAAWQDAAAALERADSSERGDARYERVLAHGERMGALDALMVVREMYWSRFPLLPGLAPLPIGEVSA